jgi:hypothetical protein
VFHGVRIIRVKDRKFAGKLFLPEQIQIYGHGMPNGSPPAILKSMPEY